MRSALERALRHGVYMSHVVHAGDLSGKAMEPWCTTCGLRFPEHDELGRRPSRLSTATVTIAGTSGALIPHGARVAAGGRCYTVRWPVWRRILFWLGVKRVGLYSKLDGADCPTSEEQRR